MVANWEWWARLQFELIVLVAVLGGTSAAIQAIDSKRTKVATVLIGATVGVLDGRQQRGILAEP